MSVTLDFNVGVSHSFLCGSDSLLSLIISSYIRRHCSLFVLNSSKSETAVWEHVFCDLTYFWDLFLCLKKTKSRSASRKCFSFLTKTFKQSISSFRFFYFVFPALENKIQRIWQLNSPPASLISLFLITFFKFIKNIRDSNKTHFSSPSASLWCR